MFNGMHSTRSSLTLCSNKLHRPRRINGALRVMQMFLGAFHAKTGIVGSALFAGRMPNQNWEYGTLRYVCPSLSVYKVLILASAVMLA
jgi:hypothetical protein